MALTTVARTPSKVGPAGARVRSRGARLAYAGCAVAALSFIGYFRRWSQFGFYGDDAAMIGGAINRSWHEEFQHLLLCLTGWPQGRPLGFGINLGVVPHAVFAVGGLGALHLFAFALLAVNATLLYAAVARSSPPVVAFAVAAFYAASPADTVKPSLVYGYNFEIAILFGLLAVHAALSRRAWSFSLAVIAALWMVEPVALFALAAPPFLLPRGTEGRRAWLVRHVCVWTGVVALVLSARRLVGDSNGGERVGEALASPLITLHHAVGSAWTGLATHADLVAERVLLPAREGAGTGWTMVALAGAVALGTLLALSAEVRGRGGDKRDTPPPVIGAVSLVGGGVLTMLACYAAYFRLPWYPASWRDGFLSGVHVVPALGAALVFGGLVQALLAALPRRLGRLALLLPAVALAMLAGFGDLVQQDYATSWRFQKEFWRAYTELCRDAADGTYVVVRDRGLPPVRYTDLLSWTAEILPDGLFQYHEVVARPPVVMLGAPKLAQLIRAEGSGFRWTPAYHYMLPKGPDEQPQPGNVIVLERREGRWRRVQGDAAVVGGTLRLRPAAGDFLGRLRARPLAHVFGVG